MSLHIGKKEKANLDVIRVAALLHDTARVKEKEDHASEGADLAKKILLKEKCKRDFIEAVCHCIKTHRFRSRNAPETLEARILYDADKLDAIGATGIARAYLKISPNIYLEDYNLEVSHFCRGKGPEAILKKEAQAFQKNRP